MPNHLPHIFGRSFGRWRDLRMTTKKTVSRSVTFYSCFVTFVLTFVRGIPLA
jgi:hypothetical protein